MIGIWLMQSIRNNYVKDEEEQNPLGKLNTMNLVEIGPGSGIMMSDIIRVCILSHAH